LIGTDRREIGVVKRSDIEPVARSQQEQLADGHFFTGPLKTFAY
jgi:hypothetical protein